MVVRLLLNQLGCHVQRRPFDGGHKQRAGRHGSGKPKITQLYNTCGVGEILESPLASIQKAISHICSAVIPLQCESNEAGKCLIASI